MSLYKLIVAPTIAMVVLALFATRAVGQDTSQTEVVTSAIQSAAQVRDRIRGSGMTPEQIRSRLRARGLNESILDEYIGGSAGGAGAAELIPSKDVLAAIAVLGGADQRELDAATRRPVTGTAATLPTTLDGLDVFGMNVFKRLTNQFEPNLAGPVDANYRLGPLDVVSIIATGQVELAHSLEVTRGGYILIPQVGQVYVANLTLGEATTAIVQGMRRVYQGAGTAPGSATRISVNVARLRTNQVFVIGEVGMPGSYQVSAAGTALSALYAAGGPTINGSMRHVEVRRGNAVITTFDMYDYLLRGDASKDIRLENGDIVFVPSSPKHVAIVGEIVRPAVYELKDGESLADLVAAAGGYRASASRTRLEVSRILSPGERSPGHEHVVFDVQGQELLDGSAPRTPMLDDDRVTVFGVDTLVRDAVYVTGNVWQPGQMGFRTGMRVSQAIKKAGGLKPGTYMQELQISRTLPDHSTQTLRGRFVDTIGTILPDIELRDEDSIRVFSRADFRPVRAVPVAGEVNFPTDVPFSDGLTLRQAILAAGGLKESAYLPEVEISRIPDDRTGGKLATVFRVPLDSSYIFEIGPDGKYLGPPGVPAPARKTPEVQLKAYDRVNVLEQPEWSLGGTVVLTGEVRFPGSYAIKSKDERITDIIARAGGLTDRAFPEGVVFRRPISPTDGANRDLLLQRVEKDRDYSLAIERIAAASKLTDAGAQSTTAAATAEQSALFDALRNGDDEADRIAIDLTAALRNPHHVDNFVVHDGDSLSIPQLNPVVTVRGFVNAPVVLPYHEGASLEDYIAGAGGVTQNADLNNAFVQQPSGRVEMIHSHRFRPKQVPVPRPGAVIVVPPKQVKVQSNTNQWAVIMSALATFATATAAIISLTR